MSNNKRCGVRYHPRYNERGVYTVQYCPLLNLETTVTIYPTFSKTELVQLYINPSKTDDISEAAYEFPLLPNQTVNSFTAHVGDKTIKGVVKSKPAAKKTYDEAVARGETAGLLENLASDVWSTKLGNIPQGETIKVVITTIQELAHDSGKDTLRYVMPTYIAPRYGDSNPLSDPSHNTPQFSCRRHKFHHGFWEIWSKNKWVEVQGGMKITVLVDMNSPVQMVEAPQHPTQLQMGTLENESSSFDPTKARLTLSNETAALDKDFTVLIKTATLSQPVALLQRHPDKNSAALSLTLVPKFKLPTNRPELVFVVDRSGSMCDKMDVTIKALHIFLKSLPVGVKFNICSFGSKHSFLWPESRAYNETTLSEAQKHVSGMSADFGGTEMLDPIKDVIKKRFKDLDLEVLVLTDGEIWNQQVLFSFVTDARESDENKNIRIFTLGVGNTVSHGLVEGLASVGGGTSQLVQAEEKLEVKMVRMLRAALQAHTSDYSIDLKSVNDDDYDMVDNSDTETLTSETTKGQDPSKQKGKQAQQSEKKISLFDATVDLDTPIADASDDKSRWEHLPPLPVLPPKIQTPFVIPPLFPFSRTNVYIVLSPIPDTLPQTVYLHAKTLNGDKLELEIPVTEIETGTEIHQLAARSFISELERGQGYLHNNVLTNLNKEKMPGRWEEIVEREGVRWGEGFGVAGKWTSFVAVQDNDNSQDISAEESGGNVTRSQNVQSKSRGSYDYQKMKGLVLKPEFRVCIDKRIGEPVGNLRARKAVRGPAMTPPGGMLGGSVALASRMARRISSSRGGTGSFTEARLTEPESASSGICKRKKSIGASYLPAPSALLPPENWSVTPSAVQHRQMAAPAPQAASHVGFSPVSASSDSDEEMGFGLYDSEPNMKEGEAGHEAAQTLPQTPDLRDNNDRLQYLIKQQHFSGKYTLDSQIVECAIKAFGSKADGEKLFAQLQDLSSKLNTTKDVIGTALAILVFEKSELKNEKDVWELIVEKARDWCDAQGVDTSNVFAEVEKAI